MSSVNSCLNVLRRTPPSDTEQNLAGLTALLSPNEDAAEELLQRVDAPLKIALDSSADDRPYVLCDHNRDGDSHRSPWSNTYHPPLADGFKPSHRLRTLEVHANEVFDSYRDLYYGKDAISSVYLWDQDDGAGDGASGTAASDFAACFLIKKAVSGDRNVEEGYWNSVHVVGVGPATDGRSLYKLATTILVSMTPSGTQLGSTNVAGSLSRQIERVCNVSSDSSHIVNIGQLIEEMEIEMRSNMDALYIQKTKEVVESIRKKSHTEPKEGQKHHFMLNEAILARGARKSSSGDT